ncbi:hypothetical protein E5676_scaffold228G00360 [Cucumis melo var. makuwa]|uniref:Uncharacterized protein n=1 Tax=Cucumis melo var. makuwa TaxID=1194695 RepID=A0A5A7TC05_CUCMM|nr:hypothetical protein E6C27_scaffold125G002070 [Cucumis melo var. makuwa]TYK20344.1 hypothetical protein E5676_scaffold228G00360 [Cucumis melo var. makuwa]
MLKNVGENKKYVGKGYANVHYGVRKNIERNASGRCRVGTVSGKPLPTPIYASAKVASGIPLRRTLC